MFILEPHLPFSRSRIWQLQRDYFNEVGIDAWRSGEVPHYLTSNPVVGKTYAELVLAFLRDLASKGQTTETVYLVELGAGHGRLCYHFFKHFEKYYEQSSLPLPPFCYILSDFTEANLTFWKDHPRLQPYLSKGWLDLALFDAESGTDLPLQQAGITLSPQSLQQPLLVISNYFFDTIPQELFRIQKQKISQALLSLSTEKKITDEDPGKLIDALILDYKYKKVKLPAYPDEPVLNELLDFYRRKLQDTHLLFPHVGVRCLENLRNLSTGGLVVLSADKGEHQLTNLDNNGPPQLATHGSFSLSVNYHALSAYCQNQGGLSLTPRHQQASLDLVCLLLLPDPNTYLETIQAYERFVSDYGPDDYFSLKKLVEQHFDTLTYRDTMAVLRLSGYDARIFRQMLPRLHELVPTITENERWNLLLAIPRIWDTFYPLGESADLAADLGDLLYNLGFYAEATLYYEKSILIYGKDVNVLYKKAVCLCLSGGFTEATPILAELRDYNPGNETIEALISEYADELSLSAE